MALRNSCEDGFKAESTFPPIPGVSRKAVSMPLGGRAVALLSLSLIGPFSRSFEPVTNRRAR